ncbi:unnamed protein product [Soboliphyme baturini]|uniref:NADAR domain-containing protein n=1 Tax=Soboliphyme baturini TaxID=241478 RepID=A0A183IXV1_9BILA|nr:unnamed protein product [Soboliphyme baturini]
MGRLIAGISSFFTAKQVSYMLEQSPQILLSNFEELKQKYEYIYYMIGLDNTHVWFQYSLMHIQMRHECVLRTGAFVKPDPKRPFISSHNPKLWQILDSDDKTFATEVCGISLAEYDTFQRMYERQREREDGKTVEYYKVDEAAEQDADDE